MRGVEDPVLAFPETRQRLRELDCHLPLASIRSMEGWLSDSLSGLEWSAGGDPRSFGASYWGDPAVAMHDE